MEPGFNAFEVLVDYVARYGWSIETQVAILCDYIDNVEGNFPDRSFEGFLDRVVKSEDEAWED
jgi:hypothetical protein